MRHSKEPAFEGRILNICDILGGEGDGGGGNVERMVSWKHETILMFPLASCTSVSQNALHFTAASFFLS